MQVVERVGGERFYASASDLELVELDQSGEHASVQLSRHVVVHEQQLEATQALEHVRLVGALRTQTLHVERLEAVAKRVEETALNVQEALAVVDLERAQLAEAVEEARRVERVEVVLGQDEVLEAAQLGEHAVVQLLELVARQVEATQSTEAVEGVHVNLLDQVVEQHQLGETGQRDEEAIAELGELVGAQVEHAEVGQPGVEVIGMQVAYEAVGHGQRCQIAPVV